MHEGFACIHVSTLIPYLVLEEVRRWARSFRTGVPGFCKPLRGFWEPNPDILKNNKCSSPPNKRFSPSSNFLILPRSTCLGMVLPTMCWSLLYQSLNKTISGRHIHKAIWLRQYFNWGSLFPGTKKGNWHTWILRTFNSSPHLLRQMLYQASHFTSPPLCFINQLFASS